METLAKGLAFTAPNSKPQTPTLNPVFSILIPSQDMETLAKGLTFLRASNATAPLLEVVPGFG